MNKLIPYVVLPLAAGAAIAGSYIVGHSHGVKKYNIQKEETKSLDRIIKRETNIFEDKSCIITNEQHTVKALYLLPFATTALLFATYMLGHHRGLEKCKQGDEK